MSVSVVVVVLDIFVLLCLLDFYRDCMHAVMVSMYIMLPPFCILRQFCFCFLATLRLLHCVFIGSPLVLTQPRQQNPSKTLSKL